MLAVGWKEKLLVVSFFATALLLPPASAVELQSETAVAFDRYIRATEKRMDDDLRDDRFLVIDRLPDPARQQTYSQLRQGQVHIEQVRAKQNGKPILVPGGLIHHWVGAAFIRGSTLSRTIAVLHNYENHKNVYKPDVRQSRLLEHHGNEFKVYLQFYRKSIVRVVINANFDVHYTMFDPTRAMSKSNSTRIADVENAGTASTRRMLRGYKIGHRLRGTIVFVAGEGGERQQFRQVSFQPPHHRASPAASACESCGTRLRPGPVEEALRRVRDGSFGRCLSCGDEINSKRLEAVPWTRYCIARQERIERAS